MPRCRAGRATAAGIAATPLIDAIAGLYQAIQAAPLGAHRGHVQHSYPG